MKVKELTGLLGLVRRLDDVVLNEVASLPRFAMRDYADRVIVAVARGEQEWRADV